MLNYSSIIVLNLTFFCKRGNHSDCPGSWPTDSTGECTHDCSFDIALSPCGCECHNS